LEKFNLFIQKIQDIFLNLSAEQKRRFAVFCTIAFASILTISVLMSLNINRRERNGLPGPPDRISIFSPVPAHELFFPDEPDYIPGVLLEREQRTSWTEEDAKEHWLDPLRFGEEHWREMIETAIDDFLERVP